MSWPAEVRAGLASALDAEVGLDEGFGPPTLDVPPDRWVDALTALRDVAGCTYFDWLSAVDELDQGFSVVCHVAALRGPRAAEPPADGAYGDASIGAAANGDTSIGAAANGGLAHLLLRTRIPRDAARLPTAVGVYAGAAWHERETHEMFDIDFVGHPNLVPLLLPDEFEGHPLRKEFVLAARVAKPWPGAKEPGESDHEASRAPSRRRVAPPGVPSPDAWGPRPPGSPAPDPMEAAAPARPARRADRGGRAAGRAAGARGTERPARAPRPDRTASEAAPEGNTPAPPPDDSSAGETHSDGSGGDA
ncbi:NADH-quinone oxidoreductase subunit C [Actinopolymorpha pittospori]|uniref:NADH-quinone oxidoreductase subunit C n=1 Tax=Actinopolymorpha pittospori TaxID=648752 RepID=A0A927MVB3_9ACTN|nr:NADH-quinone oxidoreductase subunit C [Actinopolymorpha pittospori]MBE1606899.1 NADH-quinone oxidoreductase subunit C [Actinopolymorpha pittospori]